MPLACSAAHIAGSQATIALALTCPAIHRAAVILVTVAACSDTELWEPAELVWLAWLAWIVTRVGEDAVVVPTTSAAAAAEIARTAQAISARSRQPVIFNPATGCLATHRLIVVAMTFGHDGSGRCTPARGHVPLSAI
jgi:hypothetical protein